MIQILKANQTTTRSVLFIILLSIFIYINLPFAMPIILAGIFALGLEDFIRKFNEVTSFKRSWCIFLTLFAGFILFWTPLSLAVYRVIIYFTQQQTMDPDKLLGQASHIKNLIISNLQKISEWTGYDVATPAQTAIEKILRRAGEILLKASTEFLTQLPSILLGTLVFAVLVFVFLLKSSRIKEFVMRYSFLDEPTTGSLIRISKYSCSVTLFSTLVIGIFQAFIIGLGSLIFSEGDFWLVLAVTFFVSFIPVIGAAPVGYVLAILAFIGGRTGDGIGMAVVATIAGSVDNVVKPLLVGRENKISPVIGFTSVVGAIIMLGLPGLLLGPVIMNLFAGTSALLLKNE